MMLPPNDSKVKEFLRHPGDLLGRLDGSADVPNSASERLEALLGALRSLVQGVDHAKSALAARADLGGHELATLAQLHFTSPLRSEQVRTRTGLTPGSVTALIDRLEERGYVRRIRPPENRRILLIELTPAGKRLTEAVFRPLIDLLGQHLDDPGLPPVAVRVACLEHTAALLERVAEVLPAPRAG
jgi:DNA-binding MarR family transcriptional regulator